jgi:transposase InsO family protein
MGQTYASFSLAAKKGAAMSFSATFTATPLEGYDAILGMSWLSAHDPQIGWRNRSISFPSPAGGPPRIVKPLEVIEEQRAATLATLSAKGLRRAHRRYDVDELYALFVRPEPTHEAPGVPTEDPAAEALLKEFADVFPDKLPNELPPVRGVQHKIELKPGSRPPPVRGLRHQSSKDLAVFEEYTRSLVAGGQLRVSNSPYGAMALIVRKAGKPDRVVVDYRGLNELTVKNKYPLPLMDELFDRVHGAKYFTKIDLRSGFHQIRIAEEDIEKTAFRTRYGSFEYLVLPMGLCNAPGTFMQLMNDTFRDLLDRSVLVFLDDILVFSRTKEEHIAHVREVLTRLRAQKLYAKRSKCELFRDEVEFLGHRIGANGLSVSQDKVQAVRGWPQPKNVHDVRSFLGLANFYRRFVKDFSKIALPVTALTKEANPFTWGPLQQEAFDALKRALCSAPVLLIADPKLPYTLNCDACDYAIGATLQQDHGNGLQPVAYMSRKLKPAEINYDVREKEFMALVDACSHWRHYLHSTVPFKLLSDHDSLKYHKSMPHLSGRLARWVEKMAEFDYTIEHIAGVKNVVADALSRRADFKIAAIRQPQVAEDPAAVAAQRELNRAAAASVRPPAPNLPAPNLHGSIVMPSQRCTAQTKQGSHCRQRTAKGQYCWNHLRSLCGLRIKRSKVVGAGMGLHADRALPAGFDVDYTGDLVPLESDSDGGAYFLEIARGRAIDAARTNSGEGRWINDPKGSDSRANAEFVLYTPPGQPRRACVRTRRPIEKGEEILVKYGAQHWRFAARQARAKARPQAKRSRRRGKRVPAPDLLAPLTETTIRSSILDDIQAAAPKDAAYTALLAVPPPGYQLEGGLLWQGSVLCIPADAQLRTRILAECHDSVTGAHFGRDKMLAAVKDRFAWAGLPSDVERYVRTCDACQRNKPSQQSTPGLLMPLPLPDRPCLAWTQDAVTGLPKTKRGHDAIQVYVERLCKLKHFAATHSTDGAAELAASFVHTVVRPHGVPESIVSDRDPRFTAHFYAELTKLMGISLHMSTARHPQSDGQSEREIRTLITSLRSFCNDHQDDWDDYLDMLELGFNSAVQASTQRSPFELLYGTKPRLPIDVALAPFAPRNPAAIDRAERMQTALRFARQQLLTAQERQTRNADRHRRSASFAVGDAVLLSTGGLQLRNFSNKLCSRFVGPFLVTAVVNANAYTLALPPQLQALHPTFNIEKLKPYRDGRAAFPSRPLRHDRPPPEAEADSNGDEVFVVERIVAKRKRGRSMQFLVAWKGYPPEENTWEPRSSLRGAAEALADFEFSQRSASED